MLCAMQCKCRFFKFNFCIQSNKIILGYAFQQKTLQQLGNDKNTREKKIDLKNFLLDSKIRGV